MGRGRQKAKQMKVARKLKYFSPDTDLNALQRELADEDSYTANTAVDEPEEDDAIDDDLYSNTPTSRISRQRTTTSTRSSSMSPSGRVVPPPSNG